MAGRNTIEVKLVGDSSDLERALSRAGKSTQTNMQKIGKAAKVGAFALGGLLAAGAAVGFKELSEMQKVTAQTEAVLKSTGNAANVTAEHVRELAESISAYSGQDDEAVQAGENLLLTFHKIENQAGANNDVFDQTVKVTADLAQAMGMDMTRAALQVGKALNDPAKGFARLQRIGVSFTKSQEKLIKKLAASGDTMGAQKVILAELNKEFGGSAKAFGETMPGKLAIAQESFRNLSAELMMGLLPAINAIASKLLVFSHFLRENPKLAKGVVIGLVALTAALVAATVAQAALNIAVLANPYVLIVGSIIAFGVAVAVLTKKFDFAREHWQLFLYPLGLFPILVATIAKAAIRHFGSVVSAINKVVDVAGQVKAAVGSMVDFVQRQFARIPGLTTAVRVAFFTILGPIQLIIAAIQRMISAIRSIPSPGDIVGGITGAVGHIPGLASGGHITRSGLAVVHRGENVVTARAVRNGDATRSSSGPGQFALVWAGPDFIRWMREQERRSRLGGSLA